MLRRALLRHVPLLALLLLATGCAAMVGKGGLINVPKDSAAQCENICHNIGLPLMSVVVMASNVGCVCGAPAAPQTPAAPGAPPPPPPAAAGPASGGMAALLVQEEAERQQQQTSGH